MTGRIQKSAHARKILGRRIRTLRRRKGWSQLELAFECGVSLPSLSRIELGRVNAKIASLAKIAWALGNRRFPAPSGLSNDVTTLLTSNFARSITSMSNPTIKPQEMHKAMGEKIRKLRLERGWSQAQMAERSGIDDGHLGQIERGETTVYLSTLAKIVQTLETTAADLFESIA
jgi:transcriptional regulator with XRE-family HTH domain